MPDLIEFTCNACGTQSARRRNELGREDPTCDNDDCRSTVRFRSVLHEVLLELAGRPATLGEVEPTTKRGMGLSDWYVMARELPKLCDYTNTFYDQEPYLDITQPPPELVGSLDFLVSSDVFEHVRPPVQDAFDSAFRLLRPGGKLVLTVPAFGRGRTLEHYPHLHRFELVDLDERVLVNRRRNGRVEVFDDLVFHGGDGATLEMRVFSMTAVKRHLTRAGFVDVQIQPDVPQYGIVWLRPPSSAKFRGLTRLRRNPPLWKSGQTVTARRPSAS